MSVFRSADNSHFFRLLQFSGPHFYQFLAEPGPSPGPFLEKVEFEGDPKIVILGTESTYMSAENSINPYIKATSGPTSSILGGSGKYCFFCRFSIREKYAKEALHVRPVPKMGPQKGSKRAPERPKSFKNNLPGAPVLGSCFCSRFRPPFGTPLGGQGALLGSPWVT